MRIASVIVLAGALVATSCASGGDSPLASTPAASTTAAPASPTTPSETPSSPTPSETPSPVPMTWAQVFDADEDAVVKLTVLTCEEGQITGSGFLVEPDVVVTAAHVVAGAGAISVQTPGDDVVTAVVLGTDPSTDTALVRLETPVDVTPLELAEEVPSRGSELAVLGYPLGAYTVRIARGVVAGLPIAVDYGDQQVARAFTTDAATNAGNSGGPVVDERGMVIGLLSGGREWADAEHTRPVEGTNYVIPIPDIRAGVEQWSGFEGTDNAGCGKDPDPEAPDLEPSHPAHEPVAATIANMLNAHGEAINSGDYESAFAMFTPRAQESLGGLRAWGDALDQSYWTEVEVLEAAETDVGATARVALQTEDLTDNGERCTVFVLNYTFVLSDSGLLIDKAKAASRSNC